MELDRLLAILARDCPYWRSDPRKYEARCGARFPDWDHGPAPKLEQPTSADFSSRYTPMGTTRVLTIGDVASETVTVVCQQCRRRGVYRAAKLAARFGAGLPLPSLLFKLANGCPGTFERVPRCQAVFDGLTIRE